ncbi:MAG: hypothetical protein M3N38_02235 [Pseudomonadota bacterium]|nr:hypothetical protein [Pseudomonadota bacterium]
MALLQVLVKMLHVPAHVVGPVPVEHPRQLVHRNLLGRSLAQASVDEPVRPVFLKTIPIPAELPLRDPQQLSGI